MLKSEKASLQRRVIICYSLVFKVMDWVSRPVTLTEVSCRKESIVGVLLYH